MLGREDKSFPRRRNAVFGNRRPTRRVCPISQSSDAMLRRRKRAAMIALAVAVASPANLITALSTCAAEAPTAAGGKAESARAAFEQGQAALDKKDANEAAKQFQAAMNNKFADEGTRKKAGEQLYVAQKMGGGTDVASAGGAGDNAGVDAKSLYRSGREQYR